PGIASATGQNRPQPRRPFHDLRHHQRRRRDLLQGLGPQGRPADQLDISTLSRNVERMRARGWLEVVPGEDARTQPFRLTVQGRRLLERAVPAWQEAQRRATELLGEEGIALLDRAARKLRESKAEG